MLQRLRTRNTSLRNRSPQRLQRTVSATITQCIGGVRRLVQAAAGDRRLADTDGRTRQRAGDGPVEQHRPSETNRQRRVLPVRVRRHGRN